MARPAHAAQPRPVRSSTRPRRRIPRGKTYAHPNTHGPRRCPACAGSLAHLPPLTDGMIDVLEVVARRYLEDDVTTSRDLAALHGIRLDTASKLLREAAGLRLLARAKAAPPRGGLAYHYTPTANVATYVASETLARHLLARLASPGH